MKRILNILASIIVGLSTQLHAQNEGTVYFYRSASLKGAAVNYNIYDSATLVGKMTPGQVLVYHVKPGLHLFSARMEAKTTAILNVEAGKLYFVQCGVTIGAVVGNPTMRQVTSKVGIPAIRKINPALTFNEGLVGEALVNDSDFKTDTLRALSNLYARKRKGGVARGIVFMVWAMAGMISGDEAVLPGVVVLGAVSVSGFAQSGKFNAVNQQKAIEDYQSGTPLPVKIKSKFKEKDFD